MNETRLNRVNDEIKKTVAECLRSEVKDPRLGRLITVTRVKTTNDLKLAKVYVSIMGEAAEKAEVKTALDKSAGFIRKRVAEEVNLRFTPELKFIIDDSLDESLRIGKLLDEALKN